VDNFKLSQVYQVKTRMGSRWRLNKLQMERQVMESKTIAFSVNERVKLQDLQYLDLLISRFNSNPFFKRFALAEWLAYKDLPLPDRTFKCLLVGISVFADVDSSKEIIIIE